jgi:FkbM family methyltransferase
MSVKGLVRYQKLIKNIYNWEEYIFHKGERKKRPLKFTTRPHPIHFEVPESIYPIFKEIFMEDVYNIDTLISKLPVTPVIIDIGANAGFFNVLLFSKLKNARVLAYEPLPSNISRFRKTIEENKLSEKIQLEQIAVTGTPIAILELFTEKTTDNSVIASVFSDFDERNTQKLEVPAKSLTAIINENRLDHVDLIKLDCEGSEYDIIYNTPVDVLNKIKTLVIETHEIDNQKNNLNSLTSFLQSCGYKTNSEMVNKTNNILEARKD